MHTNHAFLYVYQKVPGQDSSAFSHFEATAFLLMLALLLPPPAPATPPPPPCQRWLGMVKASTLMPMVLEGMVLNCFLSELYLNMDST